MRRTAASAIYGFICTVLAAFLTAFYSWRLLFMTFHGKPRADHHVMEHVHESPWVMLGPLFVLSIGAFFAGLSLHSLVHRRRTGRRSGTAASSTARTTTSWPSIEHVPGWVDTAPPFVGLLRHRAGLCDVYASPLLPMRLAEMFRPIYLLFLLNKWYFDELYDRSSCSRLIWLARVLLADRRRHDHRRRAERARGADRRGSREAVKIQTGSLAALCLRHADRRRRAGRHLHAVPVMR